MKKERKSNFELLRIVAMLMIISYHIYVHTIYDQLVSPNSPFAVPVLFKRLLLPLTFSTLGLAGNGIFILISGYFMVGKGKNFNIIGTAQKLICQLLFATVILMVASVVIHKIAPNFVFEMFSINHFHVIGWFIGFYFAIILSAFLFFNRFLEHLDRKGYLLLILSLFIAVEFYWTGTLLDSIATGVRTYCLGMFYYALGGYIKRYDPFSKIRTGALILPILFAAAVVYLSAYDTESQNILTYLSGNKEQAYTRCLPVFGNETIVAIILAVSAFELFHRVEIGSIRVINFFAQGTLMVYLVHDNGLFYAIFNRKNWARLLYHSSLSFIGEITLWTVCVFLIGILVYVAYLAFIGLGRRLKLLVIKK